MTEPLHVLIVDASEDDSELLIRHFKIASTLDLRIQVLTCPSMQAFSRRGQHYALVVWSMSQMQRKCVNFLKIDGEILGCDFHFLIGVGFMITF